MTDSLNATEIAVGSLLSGNRGGAWGGGVYDTGNAFANPSSNAVRIDRNADVSSSETIGTRTIIDNGITAMRDQFDTATRSGEFARVCEKIGEMDNRASDQRFQSELRTNDRLLALQAEMNQNARAAADCCCNLKLQMCEDKSQVLAAIAAVEGRGIERALNAANAKITQLETINALSK